ncbi:MAG: NAD-binding protein [Treponema sp.]|jgi:trk system potassium uptake protein TrkA|nr:NAD-binding protein [Treponema sp.]
MRIVIAGAGLTGIQLARHLVQEKHDVSLIESNEERARHASNRLDCMVLHNRGNSLPVLEEAGIARADALVCVTDSDEVNMIICGLAASRYPKLLKIARVRNDEYAVPGVDSFIRPDAEVSRAVLSALAHGAMGNILEFPGTPYKLGSIDVAQGTPFDGLCLKDFRTRIKGESLVTLVERSQESFLPSGSSVLARGDRIHILAREEEMGEIFRLAGRSETPIRRIGIVGGGRVGAFIAEGLLDRNPEETHNPEDHKTNSIASFFKSFIPKTSRRVTIIEQDYHVCKELAARFPEALILNEDISDESFVAEERIGDLDLIITTTANQERNIITAVYLKSRGVRRAIALVAGSGYETIARQLGVDVVIPTKSVVVDSILSRLMGRGIRGIHRLGDGSVGIIEAGISDESPAAEKAITEFGLSQGGLIMLVNRGEASFIPQGGYVFKAGDKVILIAKHGSETELERFFGPRG